MENKKGERCDPFPLLFSLYMERLFVCADGQLDVAGADLRFDVLGGRRVFAQVDFRVFAPLPEQHFAVAEERAALVDDAEVHAEVDDFAGLADTRLAPTTARSAATARTARRRPRSTRRRRRNC